MNMNKSNGPTDGPLSGKALRQAETETIERATVDGVPVAVDPDVAEAMGAFEEEALDDAAADDSRFDVSTDGTHEDAPTDNTDNTDNKENGQ